MAPPSTLCPWKHQSIVFQSLTCEASCISAVDQAISICRIKLPTLTFSCILRLEYQTSCVITSRPDRPFQAAQDERVCMCRRGSTP